RVSDDALRPRDRAGLEHRDGSGRLARHCVVVSVSRRGARRRARYFGRGAGRAAARPYMATPHRACRPALVLPPHAERLDTGHPAALREEASRPEALADVSAY